MSGLFALRDVAVGEVMLTLPVIHLHHADISPASWRRFAGRMARMPARRGGIRALFDLRGYVHGCFVYTVMGDPVARRLMSVSHLCEGRLPGFPVADELMRGVQATAVEIDCPLIEIRSTQIDEAPGPTSGLETIARIVHGFEPGGQTFRKRIEVTDHAPR